MSTSAGNATVGQGFGACDRAYILIRSAISAQHNVWVEHIVHHFKHHQADTNFLIPQLEAEHKVFLSTIMVKDFVWRVRFCSRCSLISLTPFRDSSILISVQLWRCCWSFYKMFRLARSYLVFLVHSWRNQALSFFQADDIAWVCVVFDWGIVCVPSLRIVSVR